MQINHLTDDERLALAIPLIEGMSRDRDLRRVIWNAEFHIGHGPVLVHQGPGA
jgi:hypothetical protein